jgi:hypothetical protein
VRNLFLLQQPLLLLTSFVPVLAHRDLAPVVGGGVLHHPFAMMTCVKSLLVSTESSIWKKMIVSTPQNFLTAATASLASSPWTSPSSTAGLSMPSPWSTSLTSTSSCSTSSTALPTLVSASALETRISSSIPAPASSSSSRQSVLTSGSSQLPAFSKSGPLGSQGECITVEELSHRLRPLVRSYALDSLSDGTKKIYSLNWNLFVNFGALHGVNVNKFEWD